jgi:hypothetical protein
MRDMGVRGVLIYYADYKCSHSIALALIIGPMNLGCRTSSPALPALPAAGARPKSGQTSIGDAGRPNWLPISAEDGKS